MNKAIFSIPVYWHVRMSAGVLYFINIVHINLNFLQQFTLTIDTNIKINDLITIPIRV